MNILKKTDDPFSSKKDNAEMSKFYEHCFLYISFKR